MNDQATENNPASFGTPARFRRTNVVSGTLVCLGLLLAACSPSSDATPTTTTTTLPTTTTTQPTTTAQPTTTSTTSTTTTTTPPPTTDAVTPADPAEAEIAARLDKLWTGWNACLADPVGCDVQAWIAEYTTPGSPAANLLQGSNQYLVSNGYHAINVDKVEHFIISIKITGDTAATDECVRDGSATVRADGSIVDDSTGFYRFTWGWVKEDGRWVIITGENIQITGAGGGVCGQYFG